MSILEDKVCHRRYLPLAISKGEQGPVEILAYFKVLKMLHLTEACLARELECLVHSRCDRGGLIGPPTSFHATSS